jgi:hypothetical protein
VLLIPHGRPVLGRTDTVGDGAVGDGAVGGGATVDGATVDGATAGDTATAELATGTGADAEATVLAGAPLEAAGAPELARAAVPRWCAVQPEITNAAATRTTTRRTLRSAITGAARRVAAALGCAAGPR